MGKSKQVNFGEDFIKVTNTISEKMPSMWKAKNKEFSKKVKEIFWKGAESYADELGIDIGAKVYPVNFTSASKFNFEKAHS